MRVSLLQHYRGCQGFEDTEVQQSPNMNTLLFFLQIRVLQQRIYHSELPKFEAKRLLEGPKKQTKNL